MPFFRADHPPEALAPYLSTRTMHPALQTAARVQLVENKQHGRDAPAPKSLFAV